MKILALDPSTTKTGLALVEMQGDTLALLDHATLTPPRKYAVRAPGSHRWYLRSLWTAQRVGALLDSLALDLVVRETPYNDTRRAVTTFAMLYALGTVLDHACYLRNVPTEAFAPSTAEKEALSKAGRARGKKKAAMQDVMADHFGVALPDDEADAVALAMVALAKREVVPQAYRYAGGFGVSLLCS